VINNSDNIVLEDGSTIAVVGGGPSGSFFTYFALDFASRYGLDIDIDIFEAKDFTCAGPTGCNHCGGIVSESLVQMLSTEGIILPSNIIRRGIDSYTMHLEQGSIKIETPLHEQRIASVYRGSGPKGTEKSELESFDNHLLQLCKKKGANIIIDRVIDIERVPDGIIVKTKNAIEKKYDFVVGAVGLNWKTSQLFQSLCPSYTPPVTTKTYISELYLDRELIDEYYGNSMHVFLLNIPRITFGALIPKGKYVTLVLLGSDINKDVVESFTKSKEVGRCSPPDIELDEITPCKCFPTINIKAGQNAFSDRVVLIGDSSASKLYKNGIGAAYTTAKAAASTAIFHGISESAFHKYFEPTCKDLHKDNTIGKFIFFITRFIQKSTILKYGIFSLVLKEQKKAGHKRRMSSILWDTFTGSETYRNIFLQFLNPLVFTSLFWHIITANLNRNKIRNK